MTGIADPSRPWNAVEPGRFMGRGHPAGDFLQAYDWTVEREERGTMRVRCHLPDHVRNPRGQLFGGFTPTYIDLLALFTVRAGRRGEAGFFLATTNMRVDYFEPIMGPEFVMEGHLEKVRGRMNFVACRFYVGENFDNLAVFALATMRKLEPKLQSSSDD
jgi:acyl-coenzyme A thioesterase PaaI-like protein